MHQGRLVLQIYIPADLNQLVLIHGAGQSYIQVRKASLLFSCTTAHTISLLWLVLQ